MDKEQAVFEQITLTMILTGNSEKISVVFFVSVACFRVNSTGFSGKFHVVLKHFQNLENLILKEILHIYILPCKFS